MNVCNDYPQPAMTITVLSLLRRLREWTPAAVLQHADRPRQDVAFDGAQARFLTTMIKPSTRERVAIACHGEEWHRH